MNQMNDGLELIVSREIWLVVLSVICEANPMAYFEFKFSLLFFISSSFGKTITLISGRTNVCSSSCICGLVKTLFVVFNSHRYGQSIYSDLEGWSNQSYMEFKFSYYLATRECNWHHSGECKDTIPRLVN